MTSAEKHIINNLFECWSFVGQRTQTLFTAPGFKAILLRDSDWPKRIFDLENEVANGLLPQLAGRVRQQELPGLLTLTETMSIRHSESLLTAGFEPKLKLMGMIIEVAAAAQLQAPDGCRFQQVMNNEDAALFARIASDSFNYRVDSNIVNRLPGNDDSIKLFICFLGDEPAGCGLVFYDSQGYAGLHMIGTLPAYRGKGVAAGMTIHLLKECGKDHKTYCVLHASEAGKKVYTKLGFAPVKEVITYTLATPSSNA